MHARSSTAPLRTSSTCVWDCVRLCEIVSDCDCDCVCDCACSPTATACGTVDTRDEKHDTYETRDTGDTGDTRAHETKETHRRRRRHRRHGRHTRHTGDTGDIGDAGDTLKTGDIGDTLNTGDTGDTRAHEAKETRVYKRHTRRSSTASVTRPSHGVSLPPPSPRAWPARHRGLYAVPCTGALLLPSLSTHCCPPSPHIAALPLHTLLPSLSTRAVLHQLPAFVASQGLM
jgi:hypothetical protein